MLFPKLLMNLEFRNSYRQVCLLLIVIDVNFICKVVMISLL
nr:MAG TPA: hypothetical protein [Caudoviricetes sp.]